MSIHAPSARMSVSRATQWATHMVFTRTRSCTLEAGRTAQSHTEAFVDTGWLAQHPGYNVEDYMEAMASDLQLTWEDVTVLELGSGVGWVGMMLAANLPKASTILCTEQAGGGALAWLQQNIARNDHLDLSALHTCVCDWSNFGSIQHAATPNNACDTAAEEAPLRSPCAAASCDDRECSGRGNSESVRAYSAGPRQCSAVAGDQPAHIASLATCRKQRGVDNHEAHVMRRTHGQELSEEAIKGMHWDFIIGADLIYNDEGCRSLPKVMATLASRDTKILYCHTKRRFEHLDMDFLKYLQEEGLHFCEVHEPWVSSPPPSPEAFTTLFPEMRIAVYMITKV